MTLLRTMYDVANKEQIADINSGGTAIGSPGKNAKMSVVASVVRVMATFMAAAVHRMTICTGIVEGKKKYRNRPKAEPAHMRGKIYPPRSPPATVNEMATSFAHPIRNTCNGLESSNPVSPVVGQMFGKSFAKPIFATT